MCDAFYLLKMLNVRAILAIWNFDARAISWRFTASLPVTLKFATHISLCAHEMLFTRKYVQTKLNNDRFFIDLAVKETW